MSSIRPECHIAKASTPTPSKDAALCMIRDAVREQPGLIKGKLHSEGMHCAIGSFFAKNPKLALPSELVDEVAMFNDSVQTSSPRVRKNKVLAFLNFKLDVLRGKKKAS